MSRKTPADHAPACSVSLIRRPEALFTLYLAVGTTGQLGFGRIAILVHAAD